jgi:hypothetical protein
LLGAFDFLSLSDAHEERELEAGLIANIRNFLTEMGSNFTFVGSQYRLTVEGTTSFSRRLQNPLAQRRRKRGAAGSLDTRMSTSNTTLAHCVMVLGTTSGVGLASLFPQLCATIAKENAGAAGDVGGYVGE